MSEIEHKKEFTGVWLPKDIIENTELGMSEIIIYSEIASYSKCFKSNKSLGERWAIGERRVSDIIASLKKHNCITVEDFDGRHRILIAQTDSKKWISVPKCEADTQKSARQTSRKVLPCIEEKCDPATQKSSTKEYSIDKSKDNTQDGEVAPIGAGVNANDISTDKKPIANKTPANQKPSSDTVLRCIEIYDAYPRKAQRGKAIVAIERAGGEIGFDLLLEYVNRYAEFIAGQVESGDIEMRFVPYPANWFGNNGWEQLEETSVKSDQPPVLFL